MARILQINSLSLMIVAAYFHWNSKMIEIDQNERLHILLVEHSSERSHLIRQMLDDGQIGYRLHRVADLMEALAYLREDMPYFNAPRPDFVILGQSHMYICCCELLAEVRRKARFAGLKTIGIRDSWWQRLHPDKPVSFSCCNLERVKAERLPETIKKLEGGSLGNLLRNYG